MKLSQEISGDRRGGSRQWSALINWWVNMSVLGGGQTKVLVSMVWVAPDVPSRLTCACKGLERKEVLLAPWNWVVKVLPRHHSMPAWMVRG